MAELQSIKINTFRGISNLNVDNLSRINLIVGDNNCGKTSVLEAIQLLRAPQDINNIYRVSRMRDSNSVFARMSIYDSFINMLSGESEKKLSVSCKYKNNLHGDLINNSVKISGNIKKVMVDINEIKKEYRSAYTLQMIDPEDNETDEFSGTMISEYNNNSYEKLIKINRFTKVTGREIEKDELIKIIYLSPISHTFNYTFNKIIKSDKYKKLCIKMLKMFDSNIEDILYLKTESLYRPVEYVKNKSVGLMPLSTYGDGIKKVLSIANAVAQAQDGILLIDEVETAIHSKYYNEIFNFIVKAAIQHNVQLFITTHNIEAVDGLLNTQVIKGEYVDNDDIINVITLRKDTDSDKTLSRTLTGKEVYNKRENFNFEVRI